MFYLTTHSTHFIYGYKASDIRLRTILIVRKETRCRHIGYSYRLTARVILYAPSHRQDNTYHGHCYTSRGALAGTEGIKEMFYLTTHSTHFIYGYMASEYSQISTKEETRCRHMGYSFRLAAKDRVINALAQGLQFYVITVTAYLELSYSVIGFCHIPLVSPTVSPEACALCVLHKIQVN